MQKRIAINEVGGAQWTGGITYRVNLLKALQVHPDLDFSNIFLIVSSKADSKNMPIPEDQILELPRAKGFLDNLWCRFQRKYFSKDVLMARLAKKHKLDVVFPAHLKAGRAKSVYWMPDFQFMHLPHLFPKQTVNSYNSKLPGYFNSASSVVLSSEDARKDLQRFSPQFMKKARVMRFVAHVPENVYDQPASDVTDVYNLPERFIYMPNQFWAHKNHAVVFQALHLLKKKGIRPMLVLTGNPVDVRNPTFLAGMLETISKLGIREQVAMLGLIPHHLVYTLMRHSLFVINPSFFEGWSTTVEECKSLGKKMILSDLNVHREQNPAGSLYFDPNNAEELADKIEVFWKETVHPVDEGLETAARNAIKKRSIEFATRFLEIVNE